MAQQESTGQTKVERVEQLHAEADEDYASAAGSREQYSGSYTPGLG